MSVPDPPSTSNDEKRAGLEPEEFQKRLVFVTLIVLILGLGGGTCLGYKIKRAEQYQQHRQNQASNPSDDSSSERPEQPPEAPGSNNPTEGR